MKGLLLSALLLIPATWAQPVAAQSEMAVVRSAFTRLVRRGVRLSVSECPPGIAGRYQSSTRTLTVCHAAIGKGLGVETIAHESIHVAQDCLYGRLGDGLTGSIYVALRSARSSSAKIFLDQVATSLARLNKADHAIASSRHLDSAGRAAELEAYGFEHDIDRALTIVEATCPLI